MTIIENIANIHNFHQMLTQHIPNHIKSREDLLVIIQLYFDSHSYIEHIFATCI